MGINLPKSSLEGCDAGQKYASRSGLNRVHEATDSGEMLHPHTRPLSTEVMDILDGGEFARE